MSFDYSRRDLQKAIESLRLPDDACLLTAAAFYRLGRLKDTDPDVYYINLCRDILEVLSPSRTLVVHAFTNFVGRYGHPFVWEQTLTSTSKFDQQVLMEPGRSRSLHPLHSFAAVGARAEAICELKRKTNYGLGSALDLFVNQPNAYVLRIGIDPFHNSLAHHAEALVNVPYCYQKILQTTVIRGGREVLGPWYAYVRYLHLKLRDDYTILKGPVTKAGLIQSVRVGRGFVHLLDAKAYLKFMVEQLIHNPFFLLGSVPDFPTHQIPNDGITLERESSVVDITKGL